MTDFFDVELDGWIITVRATVYRDGTIEVVDRVFEEDAPIGWGMYMRDQWIEDYADEIERQIKQQMEVGG